MPRRPVIGIVGASASGKTTLANALIERHPGRFCHLSLDRYYHDLSDCPMAAREAVNFDHPSALDTAMFTAHIQALSQGRAVEAPVYDFATHTRAGLERLEPSEMILIDGIIILALEEIRCLIDFSVFLDIGRDEALRRKIIRDARERERAEDFAKKQFEDMVWPMYLRFAEPSKQFADEIIPQDTPLETQTAAFCQLL